MGHEALSREGFFRELRERAEHLARRYAVFLVDHGRGSRSTHRFWWDHFEEACQALGIPCWRVTRASDRWPQGHRREKKRGVYLFFTRQSLYHDRLGVLRAVRPDAIRSEDVVVSWDQRVVEEFEHCCALRIGFRSERWQASHGLLDRSRTVIWEPYAPLAAVLRGLEDRSALKEEAEFAYFGTLNPHNYDQFQSILRPLAGRHRCRYAGKLWRIFSPTPLRYGFTLSLVPESQGLEILMAGRVNLVIHNDYHRRDRSVTERLFVSAALGRPVVCDNAGAWDYFSPEQVPVGESAEAFLALCESVLQGLQAREEIAAAVREKVMREYTYLHTVIHLLTEIDSRVTSHGM